MNDSEKYKKAFNDEIVRRETFKKELEQMKLDFDLYLKEKYSEIVGEKNIKDGDIEKKKKKQIVKLKRLNKEKNNWNKKWFNVEEEKLRKKRN